MPVFQFFCYQYCPYLTITESQRLQDYGSMHCAEVLELLTTGDQQLLEVFTSSLLYA